MPYRNCNFCNVEYKIKPYQANISKYCSKKCHGLACVAGKNKNRIICICKECGKEYSVPKCRTLKGKRKTKHCSRLCHNRSIARENKLKNKISWDKNGRWKNGVAAYRKFKKENCEICYNIKNLEIHHIDKNRYNNDLSNLLTICRSCHHKLHKKILNIKKMRTILSFYDQQPTF